jgi:hypothetical protein
MVHGVSLVINQRKFRSVLVSYPCHFTNTHITTLPSHASFGPTICYSNSYVNHWDMKSYMVNVEDVGFRGGGDVLKQKIWNAARDTIQEWTGQRLAECSLYGIRVYEDGAVLATHVDRLPLVSSAIINVDQDVDEPWPLEVIGHDGRAYNVTGE